ncbi:hypothetical protein Y032_0001g100 [Ancylostoma ceylanicum]|uniref:Uncharacterized protein n=1 Tax=Ancylostoma ceylanicum TaxID=53326 RepID=A0A016W2C7_9BILA|nr:hypothetical protein Y032_0001g100 [Ancylostoma ceylanicum]
MCDAPRIRLHLNIVEALNACVSYTVTCGVHPMCKVSASSSQTSLAPMYRPRGMYGLAAHGRDRTIDHVCVCVCVQRASYSCATRVPSPVYLQ